jgi:hypothetical protein
MGEGATSVSILSRLAATTAAVIMLCVSSGAQASGDRYYDFENGIPADFTIRGPGWEILDSDTQADGQYIGNRLLQNGEETSFFITTRLSKPSVLSFRYSSTSHSETLRVMTNQDEFSFRAERGEWQVFRTIIEAGEQTISWHTDAQSSWPDDPDRVLIDSIRISQPTSQETQFFLANDEHAFYPNHYYWRSLERPSIELLDNRPLFRQSILSEHADYDQETFFSLLSTPAPQGGLQTVGRPFVSGRSVAPKFFNFEGEPFIAVKRNSGWNEDIIDLLDFETRSRISTFPTRVRSPNFSFSDVSGDGELDIIVVESTYITAYDFQTAEIHWQLELDNIYPSSIKIDDLSPSPGSEILLAAQPGLMLSARTGEVLWSYPLGFRVKMETGDFDGDGKTEFISLDANENLVVFDPRLRSPVATFPIPNAADAQLVDLGNDGRDELLNYRGMGEFELFELETGGSMARIQFNQNVTGFHDAETNDNGEILIAMSMESPPQYHLRYGFANLTTGDIYDLSETSGNRHPSYFEDAVGLVNSPNGSASGGFVLLAGAATDRGNSRLQAIDPDTLEVNRTKSYAIDTLLPESVSASAFGVGETDLAGERRLIVLGSDGYNPSFYIIDPESDTLVDTIPAAGVPQNSWYVQPIGGGDVLIHDRRQIHIFNLLSESITWSSVAFDETIERATVYTQEGRKKVFLNTDSYMASLDLSTRVFDHLIETPTFSRVLGVNAKDGEILLKSGAQVDIYSLESFQPTASFTTALNAITAWTLSIADKHYLFATMGKDWLQVIERSSGDTVALQQTGIPQLGARKHPMLLDSSQKEATFIVNTPVSVHRFTVKLASEMIFADQFVNTSAPDN